MELVPTMYTIILRLLTFLSTTWALRCKTIPTDAAWPSLQQWNTFNKSVDGRLIKTVPMAAVCHTTNAFGVSPSPQACDEVKAMWHRPEFHEQSSSSIMSAPFSNHSCDPFRVDVPCLLGPYVSYSVDVSTQQHIIKALAFAKSHNIRFVVRNSGHDFMGKSTGHGALAVWTTHLKKTQWFKNLKTRGYEGPAVKMQAGVSMAQIFEEASAHGYSVVGGDCPSVGLGGFVQGGGVGLLSGIHGTLADNVLEYEVITSTGRIVTASPYENHDLFWALSGGGPGTHGIIWTVTAKAQPDVSMPGATLTFATSDTVSLDTWWRGVDAYRDMLGVLIPAGGAVLAVYTQGSFLMIPATLPNKTLEEFSLILDPFLHRLDDLGIEYNVNKVLFPGFHEAHSTWLPESSPLFNIQNLVVGSRLLPASLWKSPADLARVNAAVRAIVDDGGGAYDISVHPATVVPLSHNSVFPPWRQTQSELAILIPWNDTGSIDQALEQQDKMTNVYMKSLEQLAPDTGAFLQEADANDPNWKKNFYGLNYDRLLSIKDIWDPDQLLYGSTGVGGDRWVLHDGGRLCRNDAH